MLFFYFSFYLPFLSFQPIYDCDFQLCILFLFMIVICSCSISFYLSFLSFQPMYVCVFQLCNPFVYSPDESSLLNTFGNEWKRQRSIVATAFNSVSMKHVSQIVIQIIQSWYFTRKNISIMGRDKKRYRLAGGTETFCISELNYVCGSFKLMQFVIWKYAHLIPHNKTYVLYGEYPHMY